ncbi:serine/threonine kinase-like domain-containing protein STKLD1 [Pelodytes ibericus]
MLYKYGGCVPPSHQAVPGGRHNPMGVLISFSSVWDARVCLLRMRSIIIRGRALRSSDRAPRARPPKPRPAPRPPPCPPSTHHAPRPPSCLPSPAMPHVHRHAPRPPPCPPSPGAQKLGVMFIFDTVVARFVVSRVLEELRPGAFGQTCVVKKLEGEKRYAIKKVESTDERDANLALKESMALLDLLHPNVCPYNEFFMIWDNQISSLYLCLVMDYSEGGNLEDLIKINRGEAHTIDEKVIQTLLGQAVDALVHIHKQNIIHRNLKPSNILVKDKNTFLLSDFLAETLVTDEMKMKIRVYPELKVFMAPETFQFTFNEKSDVWSLGCIIVDLMMCSSHTETEASSLLQQIKHNPTCLESTLQMFQEAVGYSADLCQSLRQMLQIDPANRITAVDLVRDSYIKKCLTLIGSPLSGLKKQCPQNLAAELNGGDTPESVLELMEKYSECEDAQISTLRHLSGCIADLEDIQQKGLVIQLIEQAMMLHSDCLEIQQEGSRILKDLLYQELKEDGSDGSLTSKELIATLVSAVRRFPETTELVSLIIRLFVMMSAHDEAAELLGKTGFLQDLVKILERSQESRDLCLSCCDLLWPLAMTESASELDWLESSVPLIFSLIRERSHDGQLAESACCCLWILCLKGCVAETHIEPITWVLLESLVTHRDRPVLVKNVCLALASLLRTSELAAYQMLVPSSGKSGISLIIDLYRRHADDPEIVENVCLLFSEIVQYGGTRTELQCQDGEELMHEIKEKFESTEEIITLAQSILHRLES